MKSRNFQLYEVPVAQSMLELLQRPENYEPAQIFIFLWIAFNNIYATLSDKAGERRYLKRHNDGAVKTSVMGNLEMPKTDGPSEREQIEIAFKDFSAKLKKTLILHESTRFFVNCSPRWKGSPIEIDGKRQRLNGVLNVGHTTSVEYPVWSPINVDAYNRYVVGKAEAEDEDLLAEQILWVLYTVRNNTFHGGKRMDDSNDFEVLRNATFLLELIITDLLH